MLALLRHPRWLFGLVLMGLGTVLNVVALALAPITVVQPIGALALVITTLLGARASRTRISRRLGLSVLACLVGSFGFVLLGVKVRNDAVAVTEGQTRVVMILTAVAIVGLGALSAALRRRIPAFGYVIGAGVLYGLVAVQVKLIASSLMLLPHRSAHSIWEWALNEVPWLVVLGVVAAAVLGGWFVQQAYSSGPPDLVIAGLTVIDPFVGVAVGIAVLNELKPGFPPLIGVAMGLSAALAMVGVLALARFHPDAQRSPAGDPELLKQP